MEIAWLQYSGVISLDHKQHRCLVTAPYLFPKLQQMSGGALAHGIGKIGATVGVDEVAILHFDKVPTLPLGEQEVDARSVSIGDFAPKLSKPSQSRYQARPDQGFREAIGGLGVGAGDQAVDFQQFQGVQQFSFSFRRRQRHPGSRAGPQHTFHAAGVHAMGINLLIAEPYAGNESVVAGEEGSFEERAGMGEKHLSMVAIPGAIVLQSWSHRARIRVFHER